MLAAILGRKIGMTQVYDEKGAALPVTVLRAGPCTVLQVKTVESDGYNAVQLGFGEVKPRRARQPDIGHASKANTTPKRFIREVRLPAPAEGVQRGSTVTVGNFEATAAVDIIGTTKGKGFQGVMKRHHFTGQPASHGTERKHRSPGTISAHATNRGWGGDIKRGKRMGGHMGMVRSTSRNLALVGIDKDNNLLLIKGSVPGANGGFVLIKATGKVRKVRVHHAAAKAKAKAKAK
ncbi:MAG: 50S ribosomal protein L3 [Phycisphaerae bacterium]